MRAEASKNRPPVYVVVWAIAGAVVLLVAAAAFGSVLFLRHVEVEIVPDLKATAAWREGTRSTVDWGLGPIAVEVDARVLRDQSLHVRNRFRWEYMYRDVEFWVTFDSAGPPVVRADANAHDSDGTVRPFYGLHGTVKLNSARLPTAADAPLVMEYWIEGDHGGSPVAQRGTIAVYPADLR